MLPLFWLEIEEVEPNDIAAGMHICQRWTDDQHFNCQVVLRIEPSFNPRFRPIVFENDPHVAVDFDHDDLYFYVRARNLFESTVPEDFYGSFSSDEHHEKFTEALELIQDGNRDDPDFDLSCAAAALNVLLVETHGNIDLIPTLVLLVAESTKVGTHRPTTSRSTAGWTPTL